MMREVERISMIVLWWRLFEIWMEVMVVVEVRRVEGCVWFSGAAMEVMVL